MPNIRFCGAPYKGVGAKLYIKKQGKQLILDHYYFCCNFNILGISNQL